MSEYEELLLDAYRGELLGKALFGAMADRETDARNGKGPSTGTGRGAHRRSSAAARRRRASTTTSREQRRTASSSPKRCAPNPG